MSSISELPLTSVPSHQPDLFLSGNISPYPEMLNPFVISAEQMKAWHDNGIIIEHHFHAKGDSPAIRYEVRRRNKVHRIIVWADLLGVQIECDKKTLKIRGADRLWKFISKL